MSDIKTHAATMEPSAIEFLPGKGEWLMKLQQKDGETRILFNREAYPDASPDFFAQSVITILEGAYPKVDWENISGSSQAMAKQLTHAQDALEAINDIAKQYSDREDPKDLYDDLTEIVKINEAYRKERE